jgi:hypothetical protein
MAQSALFFKTKCNIHQYDYPYLDANFLTPLSRLSCTHALRMAALFLSCLLLSPPTNVK